MKGHIQHFFSTSRLLFTAVALTAAVIGFSLSKPILPAVARVAQPACTAFEATEGANLSLLSASKETKGKFTDGTYYGTGEGFSGKTKVEVVVKDGRITKVNIVSKKDTNSYFKRAKALIKDILEEQTWDVDSVSGATSSSKGIKAAVKNALTVDANKKKQSMTVKAAKTSVSYNAEKAQTIKLTVSNAQGSVSYKTSSKSITVKSGKITIAKGTKKGEYTVTVTAKGNSTYKSASKTITITVK